MGKLVQFQFKWLNAWKSSKRMLRFIVHCIRFSTVKMSAEQRETETERTFWREKKRQHFVVRSKRACMFCSVVHIFAFKLRVPHEVDTAASSMLFGFISTGVESKERQRLNKKSSTEQKNSQNYLKHSTFGLFSVTIKCIANYCNGCELPQQNTRICFSSLHTHFQYT